jgi:hypothetical protein
MHSEELSIFTSRHVQGTQGACSVVLEAVADQDLWIWHAFFSMTGSPNGINVLLCFNVFQKLVEGTAPPV